MMNIAPDSATTLLNRHKIGNKTTSSCVSDASQGQVSGCTHRVSDGIGLLNVARS